MSVRKIRPNTRSSTGFQFSITNQKQLEFESRLEQDLLFLLDVDPNVSWFDVQPLEVKFRDAFGRMRKYTPDVLVCSSGSSAAVQYTLIEVKYLAELDDKWQELKDRIKAGGEFAASRGWKFQIWTETNIRTPELWNAQFLWDFCRRPHVIEDQSWVLEAVRRHRNTTIADFLQQLYPFAKSRSSDYTVAFYQLLAGRQLQYDLHVQLSPRSLVWA